MTFSFVHKLNVLVCTQVKCFVCTQLNVVIVCIQVHLLFVCRLKEAKAKKIYAIMTHGILSGPALQRIMDSDLEAFVVTNTIPQDANCSQCHKIQVGVSV